MQKRFLVFILVLALFVSGCSKTYNGPYANTPLLTKEDVKKKITEDKKTINNKKATLLQQVQAKSDLGYYQMLLECYEYYEDQIKNVNGKQYTITAESINKFIKARKFEERLKLIERDESRWPSIFLGNLARYLGSQGFGVYVDSTSGQENIGVSW